MKPEPVFEAPWHAQLFALTVHLHDQGYFSWPDWTMHFGITLKKHGLAAELNGGDDYFNAWLDSLESLLCDAGHGDAAVLADLAEAWRSAYLRTPHGRPVILSAQDMQG